MVGLVAVVANDSRPLSTYLVSLILVFFRSRTWWGPSEVALLVLWRWWSEKSIGRSIFASFWALLVAGFALLLVLALGGAAFPLVVLLVGLVPPICC